MEFKRVLVVSHNCFSKNTNMGKTLKTYFESWETNSLAEIYFHSEIPNDKVCTNYFRITDKEALKSIFLRGKYGTIIKENMINESVSDTRIDTGNLRKVYEFGRKRKPFICFLRDKIWDLSSWNNKKLNNWLDEFKPEVIFLAAGDYAFSYKIAYKIAKRRNIPLVMCCFDDYYLNYQHKGEFFRNVFYKHLMKIAKKAIDYSKTTFAVNPKMALDYSIYFSRNWPVLFTSTSFISNNINYNIDERKGISYLGNLGYNRNLQLIKIGRFLKELNSDFLPHYIDVYSGETRKEVLETLTMENGIFYHGSINQNEVKKVINLSIATIHVESFDLQNRNLVKYSLSTKIADSLGSGTPLIAFGPKEVASMDYLIKNDCAFCAVSDDELNHVFIELLDKNIRNKKLNNAIKLAKKNHSFESVTNTVQNYINSIKEESKNEN